MDILASLYIHHINPVILDIPGTPFALRWYGLAYVAGFLAGYWVLLQLAKRNMYCVSVEKLGDFITNVCIFGVLCGGRLGEFFFYWLPQNGLTGIWQDLCFVWSSWLQGQFTLPWVFRVWEGGMASHGGILAVTAVALHYAWRNKKSFCAVLDGLAIVSPLGLCFGRIANFINGELYGRAADESNPLAMKFPGELHELPAHVQVNAMHAMDTAAGTPITTLAQGNEDFYSLVQRLCMENDAVREALGQFLTPRYPSQLFEAFGEGVVIFAVLFTVRLLWRTAPAGIFAALFAFIYAAARITCEAYKEPDAGVWFGITEGQWLSLLIALLGAGFFIAAIRNARQGKTA